MSGIRKTIEIRIGTHPSTDKRQVDALVFGEWAVHETYNRITAERTWSVTHTGTGACLTAEGFEPFDAVAVASALDERAAGMLPSRFEDFQGDVAYMLQAVIAEALA